MIGFCAGAFVVSADMFQGSNPDRSMCRLPTNWLPGIGSADVELTERGKEIFGMESCPAPLYFANGPMFKEDVKEGSSFKFNGKNLKHGKPECLVRYKSIKTDQKELKQGEIEYDVACFCSSFGKGTLLCFGPHPEASGKGWTKAIQNAIMNILKK